MCEAGVSLEECKGNSHACRSGLIVYSTMLSAEQLSDGTNLNLGLSVHDAATVSLEKLANRSCNLLSVAAGGMHCG